MRAPIRCWHARRCARPGWSIWARSGSRLRCAANGWCWPATSCRGWGRPRIGPRVRRRRARAVRCALPWGTVPISFLGPGRARWICSWSAIRTAARFGCRGSARCSHPAGTGSSMRTGSSTNRPRTGAARVVPGERAEVVAGRGERCDAPPRAAFGLDSRGEKPHGSRVLTHGAVLGRAALTAGSRGTRLRVRLAAFRVSALSPFRVSAIKAASAFGSQFSAFRLTRRPAWRPSCRTTPRTGRSRAASFPSCAHTRSRTRP